MNPLRYALLLALLIAPASVAQNRPAGPPGGVTASQGVISGLVKDAETNEAVESATIAVWNAADSSLVTGAITNQQGRFEIEQLRPGRYYVRVSFVGYRTQTVSDVNLRPNNLRADLGEIRLATVTGLLDEVQVVTERELVEVAIDRTVYNTRDQMVTTGGTASDVLENIPSVEVDADGNVSLRGNQNVAILINGKPAPVPRQFLAGFLRQLPADAIERVEVIPNPSARYEPDGMSGILNIVLRQDTDLGLNGGLLLGGSTNGSFNGSANIGWQRGKWALSSSYGLRSNRRDFSGFLFNEYRTRTPVEFLEQTDTGDSRDLSHLVNASAEYRITRQSTVSASGLVGFRDNSRSGLSQNFFFTNPSQSTRNGFERLTRNEGNAFNADLTLGFRHTVRPSTHELSAELRFNTNQDEGDQYLTLRTIGDGTTVPAFNSPDREDLSSQNRGGRLAIDFVRPLGETAKMEVGYNGTLRRLDDAYAALQLDETGTYRPYGNASNEFVFDETIHAAYAIYGRQFGKIGAQVGVRAEQALTDFTLTSEGQEPISNNYFSLFPSAFLTYAPVQTTQFRVSYSRRINRPNTRFLNPITTQEDQFNLRRGNPYLQPEYTHAIETSVTQFARGYSLSMTPFFRRTENVIRRYTEFDPETRISTNTFRNLTTSDSYGAEFVGTARIAEQLNLVSGLNLFRVVTDGSNVQSGLSSDALSWSARINGTWTVRRGTDIQLTYFYRAPQQGEQGRMGAMAFSNIGLRQRLIGDRLSLNVNVQDIFDQRGFSYESNLPSLYQEGSRRWGARQAQFNLQWNFGRMGQQNRQRRQQQEPREEMDELGIGPGR